MVHRVRRSFRLFPLPSSMFVRVSGLSRVRPHGERPGFYARRGAESPRRYWAFSGPGAEEGPFWG